MVFISPIASPSENMIHLPVEVSHLIVELFANPVRFMSPRSGSDEPFLDILVQPIALTRNVGVAYVCYCVGRLLIVLFSMVCATLKQNLVVDYR